MWRTSILIDFGRFYFHLFSISIETVFIYLTDIVESLHRLEYHHNGHRRKKEREKEPKKNYFVFSQNCNIWIRSSWLNAMIGNEWINWNECLCNDHSLAWPEYIVAHTHTHTYTCTHSQINNWIRILDCWSDWNAMECWALGYRHIYIYIHYIPNSIAIIIEPEIYRRVCVCYQNYKMHSNVTQ